jgi:hypothetical protein
MRSWAAVVGCKKVLEDQAMSLVRNGYALSTRREFLCTSFSAFLGLALFDPSLATAQQGKEIKLTEKHIQSFMAAYNDMVKVYESADPDKPDDPKVEAQAEAIVKKNGFASLAEFDDVSVSISAVMSGIDPQTKKFTEATRTDQEGDRGTQGGQNHPRRAEERGPGGARG